MAQTKSPSARPAAPTRPPRLAERYQKDLAPAIAKQFGHTNLLAAARLEKIVVNVGCGEAAHDAKILEAVQRDLGLITGQRPLVTRAKKAISNFKIREADPIGCKVTLRRRRMYEFLDRLLHVALPRIRDFRGLNPKGLDERGNYTFGIKEHTIFPEVELDRVQFPMGMDVTVVTRSPSRDEAFALLQAFGFPFATEGERRPVSRQEKHGQDVMD